MNSLPLQQAESVIETVLRDWGAWGAVFLLLSYVIYRLWQQNQMLQREMRDFMVAQNEKYVKLLMGTIEGETHLNATIEKMADGLTAQKLFADFVEKTLRERRQTR